MLTIKVFLLIVYTGPHTGYVTVDNLPSRSSCERLAQTLRDNGPALPALFGKSSWCVEHERVTP